MLQISKTVNNFHRPSWWREKALPYLKMELMRRYFEATRERGCDVMAEDWDNLVILDACRYDLFRALNDIPGDLQHRTSKGAATHEFLRRNFQGSEHYDTVYVTGNPMYAAIGLDNVFHDVIDVWEGEWDSEHNTVTPEAMTAAAERVHDRYPDKRLILHYVQPHHPFIGEMGSRVGDQAGLEKLKREAIVGEGDTDAPDVWMLLKKGEISQGLVWAAYGENLLLALDQVNDLLDTLVGKTVVTSDHGNLVGEFATPFPFREYGHPVGIHTEKLVKVPWLVTDDDRRKRIQEGDTLSSATDHSERVRETLRDLGYVT